MENLHGQEILDLGIAGVSKIQLASHFAVHAKHVMKSGRYNVCALQLDVGRRDACWGS